MRRKVSAAPMVHSGNSDESQSLQSASHEGQLIERRVDVGQFARRLGCMAGSTAQSLYSIVHIGLTHPGMQTLAELTQKIYALAAVLSGLREDLIQSGEQGVWTKEHFERLLCSMRDCEAVFRSILGAVSKADETFSALSKPATRDAYIQAFILDDERKALKAVSSCHDLVFQTTLLARYEILVRKEYIDEDQLPEALRLTLAFKNSAIDNHRACKDRSLAFERLQKFFISSHTLSASSPDAEKFETDPDPPTDPLPNMKDTVPKKQIPISAYNQWPPFGNPQHPAYLATLGNRSNNYDAKAIPTSSTASNTITGVSLGTSQPVGQTSLPPESTTQATLEPLLFGESGVVKPNSNGGSLSSKDYYGAFANHSQSNINVFTTAPHLEAFILRPMVQITDVSSAWSYETDSLQIDEEAIQAYMHRVDASLAVMESLVNLTPQELRLVQLCAKQRNGNIVLIQHGRPIDFVIQMGVIQVKPIIFIVKTTADLSQEDHTATSSDTVPVIGKSIFENNGVSRGSSSTFGPNTGFGFDPNRRFRSPGAYSQHLHEQGEPCTYVEGAEGDLAFLHYQTITMNKHWQAKDRSLEEIRLADYEAGRRGPMKTNGISYPWEVTLPERGEGNFKGFEVTLPTQVKTQQMHYFPVAGNTLEPSFGSGNLKPTKGLFGQPISDSSGNCKPAKGLFGQPVSDGFGNCKPAKGLFGQPISDGCGNCKPTKGLFGQPVSDGCGNCKPAKGLFGQNISDSSGNCKPAKSLFGQNISDGSGNCKPAKGLFGQNISGADSSSTTLPNSANKPSALCMVPPSRGPFKNMAPDLSPFAPTRGPHPSTISHGSDPKKC